jgi:outer membrane protein
MTLVSSGCNTSEPADKLICVGRKFCFALAAMRQFLRTWTVGLLLIGLGSGVASAQQRLATVDVKKVFDGYWKTKQASDQIQKRRTEMEAEFKNMLDDYKKAKDDYESLLKGANDQNVAVDERDRRKKAAEDKLRSLKDQEDGITQYRNTSNATLTEQETRMKNNILSDIKSVVGAKAKTAGFTLVLDGAALSAAGSPVIMYSNGENDLTESVLLQLNANAPVDSAKADDTTAAPDKKDEKKK